MESEGGREREKKEEVEGRRGRGGEGEGKDESRIQSLESNEQVHYTRTAHETEWR